MLDEIFWYDAEANEIVVPVTLAVPISEVNESRLERNATAVAPVPEDCPV